MKNIITAAALILLVTFYLPACKKSDKQPTTLEKVHGKWQLDTDVSNDHFSGQDNITAIAGMAGDVLDFRTDGKVYTNIQGQADTTTYSLSGDTNIVIDGNLNYDITTLTSASLILHEKVNASGTDL